MMRMQDVFAKLRRANRKNATLYLICNFVAMMLITAFAAMMFSPTVLTILPEGGDSRKQVYAIFALACAGSVIFTIYAASLFFRTKSRELGLLLALGTTSVWAAGRWSSGRSICNNQGAGCAYMDADGEGICDNHGTNCAYVDANGDGACDNQGAGYAYVDADGNGVCDNYGGRVLRPQDGTGLHRGHCGGRGC